MTTTSNAGRWGRAAVWGPGLAVALGAAVATAHGLFEVAVAARVPVGVAWIYPLITDGLALVAYAATARLAGSAARYAWSVVVVSAGLSGLAQAVYLASDAVTAGRELEVSPGLRFGVGAWPAVAAAVVAHLLYLLADTSTAAAAAPPGPRPTTEHDAGPAPRVRATITVPPSDGSGRTPVEHPGGVGHGSDVPPALDGPVIPGPPRPVSHPAPRPAVQPDGSGPGGPGGSGAGAQQRARTTAQTHRQRHGDLPTVRELQDLADVGRGTAARALQQLRDTPAHTASGLHLVPDDPQNRTQP